MLLLLIYPSQYFIIITKATEYNILHLAARTIENKKNDSQTNERMKILIDGVSADRIWKLGKLIFKKLENIFSCGGGRGCHQRHHSSFTVKLFLHKNQFLVQKIDILEVCSLLQVVLVSCAACSWYLLWMFAFLESLVC